MLEYDLSAIATDLARVGAGFLWIILLWAVMVLADTASWHYCFGAARGQVGFWRLTLIMVAGQAINSVTPSGNLGELVKGKYLAENTTTAVTVSSLIIYNFMYTLVTAVMVLAGAACATFLPQVPVWLKLVLWGASIVVCGYVVLLVVILRRGLAEKVIRFLRRIRLPLKNPEKWVQNAQQVDRDLKEFQQRYPRDFRLTIAAMVVSRMISVAEVWVVCLLLERPINPAVAFFIMAVSQLLFWVFALVPSQIGVMEQGSDSLFAAMDYQPGAGFTFELVRRARRVFQIAIGLLVLLYLSLASGRRGQTLPVKQLQESPSKESGGAP